MWKIYATKTKPFWAIQNGNKPSKAVFDEFDKTLERIKGDLNFVDFLTANFVGKLDDYKYFKLVNDINNDTKYYYVNKVEYVQDNSYVYLLALDIYATYTINFIEENRDVTLTINRTHIYDKEIGVLGDKTIDEISKSYDSIAAQKFYYSNSSDGQNKYYFNNDFGLKNPENNAYKYYVFSDGPSGTYTIFPCINNTKEIEILQSEYTDGDLIYTGYFWNGDYQYRQKPREYVKDIPSEVNEKIKEAYKKGQKVIYYYRWLKDRIDWAELMGWKTLTPVHNTMPTDLYMTGWYKGGAFASVGYTFTANGSQFDSGGVDGIPQGMGKQNRAWERLKQLAYFSVEIYDRKANPKPAPKICYNSKQHLFDIVLKDPNFSNKFLGIFAGPNLLAFKNENIGYQNIAGKQFLTITLPANGIEMDEFPIYRYNYAQKDCLNNPDLGFEYSLKYMNINYFNNNINGLLRANNQQLILLSGKLVFSNGFYLLNKSSDLISLSNSIIYFGGELPSSQDNYIKYVNSQRNSLDTTYSIKRQETTIKNTQGIVNGAIDYASAGVKAGAQIATGNFGGAAESVMGGIKSLAGGIYGIFEGERQLKNYRKTIAAQFADANVNMGNQINMSSATDAAMQLYLESNGEQYEVVEVINLTKNSNILVNNYFYLFGFYYPHSTTFLKFLGQQRKFNYLEVDQSLLQTNINLKSKFTNDILDIVKTQLINGIRIWNITNPNFELDIPDNAVDQNIPQINPNYENTPLPPPNSEIPGWEDDPEAAPEPDPAPPQPDPQKPKIYEKTIDLPDNIKSNIHIIIDLNGFMVSYNNIVDGYDVPEGWTEYDEVIINFNNLPDEKIIVIDFGKEGDFAINQNSEDLNRIWKFNRPTYGFSNVIYMTPNYDVKKYDKAKIILNEHELWPWVSGKNFEIWFGDNEGYLNTDILLGIENGQDTRIAMQSDQKVKNEFNFYVKNVNKIQPKMFTDRRLDITAVINYKGQKPVIITGPSQPEWEKMIKFVDCN